MDTVTDTIGDVFLEVFNSLYRRSSLCNCRDVSTKEPNNSVADSTCIPTSLVCRVYDMEVVAVVECDEARSLSGRLDVSAPITVEVGFVEDEGIVTFIISSSVTSSRLSSSF